MCSNIRNMFSYYSLLSLKPILINSSIIKESFFSWSSIRGVPSWIRMLSCHINCHKFEIHEGLVYFLGCGIYFNEGSYTPYIHFMGLYGVSDILSCGVFLLSGIHKGVY